MLRSLSSKDRIQFLVDGEGNMLDLEAITTNLLAIVQNNPIVNVTIRNPCLCALLGIYKSGSELVERAAAGINGVSIILPLQDDNDLEIREVSLALLYRFSQHEPGGISDFLLLPRGLDAFVSFLEDAKADVQMAVAGLLANLPKSNIELIERLNESNGLEAILNILKLVTTEAKENALGSFFRFADPSNIEMQKKVVALGAYPRLVGFLKSNSIIIKARSAAFLGCLSLSSPALTRPPITTGCLCFRRTREPVCWVHGGICSVKTSFCLVSANALPDLVKILQERVHETAYEAVQTIGTLVSNSSSSVGASILHKNEAILPLLNILERGAQELKEQGFG